MIVKEMEKYRTVLDEAGISWTDVSDILITRTHFRYGATLVSVASGRCTYGGEKGLLEVMIGVSEPEGWLSAEEVVNYIETCFGKKLKELKVEE